MEKIILTETQLRKVVREMNENNLLNDNEKKILNILGEAFVLFRDLPDKHESDEDEFAHYIHILQRHVMSRPTRRSNPDMF